MYFIEGNIGVGKSTLCDILLEQRPQYAIVKEPVQSWHSETGKTSLLERFYQSPERWAYTLETLTLINRLKEHYLHTRSDEPRPHIFERSLYSGFYCFALNGKNNGFLNNIEWNIYTEWVSFLLKDPSLQPAGFIYLQASPNTCAQRIQKRSRTGESGIAYEYLQNIHNLHEDFLCKQQIPFSFIPKTPILVLNGEEDFTKPAIQKHFLDAIDSFVTDTQKEKLKK